MLVAGHGGQDRPGKQKATEDCGNYFGSADQTGNVHRLLLIKA
jgi:hypothetical protein